MWWISNNFRSTVLDVMKVRTICLISMGAKRMDFKCGCTNDAVKIAMAGT